MRGRAEEQEDQSQAGDVGGSYSCSGAGPSVGPIIVTAAHCVLSPVRVRTPDRRVRRPEECAPVDRIYLGPEVFIEY